jgi:hypothetical protein
MDRVETLLLKLQEQFKQKASSTKLLLTVQMLQHELLHLQSNEPANQREAVTVSMPVNANAPAPTPPKQESITSPVQEEKTVEVLQVDEAEVEAELEEIKRNAALMQQISGKSKPQLLFDLAQDDIPTLAQQQTAVVAREINDTVKGESASLNEILKTTEKEVSSKLTDMPVKDLKKAIGVNDRFLYINELFRGDEVMYERSIKTINSFSIWPEAEYWIRRELKTKLGWIDSDSTVVQFDQLIKRRFS